MLFIIFTLFFSSRPSIHVLLVRFQKKKIIQKIINIKYESKKNTSYETERNEMKRKGSTPAAFVAFICLWIECNLYGFHTSLVVFPFVFFFLCWWFKLLLFHHCTCFVYLSCLTGAFSIKFWYILHNNIECIVYALQLVAICIANYSVNKEKTKTMFNGLFYACYLISR